MGRKPPGYNATQAVEDVAEELPDQGEEEEEEDDLEPPNENPNASGHVKALTPLVGMPLQYVAFRISGRTSTDIAERRPEWLMYSSLRGGRCS